MKRLIKTTTAVAVLALSFLGLKYHLQDAPLIATSKHVMLGTHAVLKYSVHGAHAVNKNSVKDFKPQAPQQTAPLKTVKIHQTLLKQVSFGNLPGWRDADFKKSLLAFQTSCKTFIKQNPQQSVGSAQIRLKAKDWQPACKAALVLQQPNEQDAKKFFEQWFYPIEFSKQQSQHGLFTGYYLPELKGNLTRTKEFTTPVYGLPKGISSWRLPELQRKQIDEGAIKKKAPVLAWVHSPAHRLSLEIEGGGVIRTQNGKNIYLGYAGENGAPYTSVGSVLIQKGVMTRDNASKKAIIRYLEKQPQQGLRILQRNRSFVFFEHLKQHNALGVKGMPLTPGYSLAVDKKYIPIGAPLWLDTTIPSPHQQDEKQLQRLMVAQDVGGAISGPMRGDIYWGTGEQAEFLGEHMKNKGQFWLLLPKKVFDTLAA